jgi:hypothetical protein
MVGNCVAVGETVQSLAHMRGAMRAGAKPREVMEVILQSTVNFGMPSGLAALRAFVRIMRDDGRLDEIGNPPQRHDEQAPRRLLSGAVRQRADRRPPCSRWRSEVERELCLGDLRRAAPVLEDFHQHAHRPAAAACRNRSSTAA